MQTALDIYLNKITGLITYNEFDQAFELLHKLQDETQAGFGQSVTLIEAQHRANELAVMNGLLLPTDADYKREQSGIRYRMTLLMKEIPGKIERYSQYKNLNTYQFQISDEVVSLEKVIGKDDNFLTIGYLEAALRASKAVCKVVRGDGESGTGFLTKDGYLFTNNHVLDNVDEAAKAKVEFNYEVGASGNVKPLSEYKLDPSDFITSPVPELDFTRVKIIDQGPKRLSEWGYLDIDPGATPDIGQPVAIIQHPNGQDKRIVLSTNEVVGLQNQYFYYTTNTKPGSSGSPVMTRDWKVVALHHAGALKPVNGRDANEGILFKNILEFIAQK